MPTYTTPQLRSWARQYARQSGVPVSLFMRQINQESGWNPTARSPAGALGVAQIVPRWHPGVDPMNPQAALRYAANLMRSHYNRYGTWRDALSAYNSGRPWEQGRGISETYNYVNAIMNGQRFGPPGSGGRGTPMVAGRTVAVETPDKNKIAALQLLSGATSFGQPGLNPVLMSALESQAKTVRQIPVGQQLDGRGVNLKGIDLQNVSLDKLAQLFNLYVTSGARSPGENDAVGGSPTSFHLSGRARDVRPGEGRFRAFIRFARRNPHIFQEFFFDPLNWYIKNGQIIQGAIGGHDDHLHYAF